MEFLYYKPSKWIIPRSTKRHKPPKNSTLDDSKTVPVIVVLPTFACGVVKVVASKAGQNNLEGSIMTRVRACESFIQLS